MAELADGVISILDDTHLAPDAGMDYFIIIHYTVSLFTTPYHIRHVTVTLIRSICHLGPRRPNIQGGINISQFCSDMRNDSIFAASSAVEEFLFEPSFSPHAIDIISGQLFAKRSPQEQQLQDQEIASSAVDEFLFEPSFSPHAIDILSAQLFAKRSPQEQQLEDQEIASSAVDEFLFEPSFSPHAIDIISSQLFAKRSPQEQQLSNFAQL